MRRSGKPDHAAELSTVSERFAQALRIAPVESAQRPTRSTRNDFQHALEDDKRQLWGSTRESQWRRHLCGLIRPRTVH